MKPLKLLFLLAVLAVAEPGPTRAQMPAPPISGVVFSNQQGRLAGVTVSLVHPIIGRSAPVFSGPDGTYFFSNVPPQDQPYFIEAYWGSQLLFRSQFLYRGWPVQFNIALP